jgi:hypothetical protein
MLNGFHFSEISGKSLPDGIKSIGFELMKDILCNQHLRVPSTALTNQPHLRNRHSLVVELHRTMAISNELHNLPYTYKMNVLLPLIIKLYGSQDIASVSLLLVASHVKSSAVNATRSHWNCIIETTVF